MPGIISENYLSRPFSVGSQVGRELVFDVQNTSDEEEVLTLVEPPLGAAPATYLGLVIDSISAEPVQVDSANDRGVWKVFVRYIQGEDDDEYTFDTGGGTVKRTQSLSTINSYAPAGLFAPDFKGAIGVSEDRVEGVDVESPVFQFTETHTFEDSEVTGAYKLILFNMTGRWNNASFKGFDAGECKFLGASGSKRGYERWSITFRFAGSPNETGVTIGDITGIDKLGWDYMWVRYADYEDPTAFALVKRPVAAYVERVSESGDFSQLNIGT
jgi:hypothetical protein